MIRISHYISSSRTLHILQSNYHYQPISIWMLALAIILKNLTELSLLNRVYMPTT